MTLDIGDKLPAFKAQTAEGAISNKDLTGSHVVIYFYPKDDTPGCTTEACEFRDNLPKFKKMNAKVYGVSKDSVKSHEKFAGKYELPFTLISDEDGKLCESFGTWVEKSMYGKKYMGIERATFLADDKGVIRQIWRNVKAKGHAEEVLAAVKNLK
ncbi:MAG: thioredoxin-dependent thiol peroxidase [Alphaproteobacteria bacterium]|nr:thioredoxin-dependent thiol peroxidase [Alphaproteobacteria bacterium]